MEPIIKAKNLNFVYNKGKDNEFHALININMEIYPEEFIVFFGPSGCGKSTLLNVIAGLEVAEENSAVSVLGRDMMKLTKKQFAQFHRHDLGMIFQAYNLITSLSVLDNIALPQIFLSIGKHKREQWGKQLLERFGILKQAKKIPTELSGGQQQRIGIARSIVNNPKIILADEPVGNLDSVSAKNVLDILSDLNEKEKKTIILVTHNPETLIYADRIFYMKDGTIIREVVNKEKRKEIEKQKYKTAAAEIDDLMRAYHGLTPEQINILIMPYKAKIFAQHFITTRSLEETKVFEDIIQRRLMGTISDQEMFEALHRSSNDGGVGFDIRTAQKIIERISKAMEMSYFISQTHHKGINSQGGHDPLTAEEKAEQLIIYLLQVCYREHTKNLKEEQKVRLLKVLKDRIENSIQKVELYNALDLPFKDGGVGLNSKTAKAVTEETELILILSFGIVKVKPEDIKIMDISGGGPVAPSADGSKQEGAAAALEILKKIKEQQGETPDNIAVDKARKIPEEKGETEDISLQEAIARAQNREEEKKRKATDNQADQIKF